MKKIYPSRYYFSKKAIDYIVKNLREILKNSSFLTMGKYCEEFEKRFTQYIGSKYAVSANSGTAALEMILSALNVKNQEVIVTTNTFAATIFSIIKAGGKPVFADILPDLTLNPNDVRKKITSKTKAVVTVHIGGMVSPATKELVNLCKKKNLYLIEDAAHAQGSALNHKKAGTFGVAAAFSFFPTKLMTTAEGGIVTTNNKELAERMKIIRNQAKENNREFHKVLGYNWRMTELEALMGIAQLKELDKFIKKRQLIASIYNKQLRNIKNLEILKVPTSVRHNYYKYIVFLPVYIKREKLTRELKKKFDIPLSGCVYERPCHRQPVFKKYVKGVFPVADSLSKKHIALPIYYEMTEPDALKVVKAIKEVINQYE